MLFQLPEDLRKSLANEEEKKISPPKPKPKLKVNRLGKIDDLLPEEIFSKSEQLKMVDGVAISKDKCLSWTKDGYEAKINYCNGHWASVWAKKYRGDSNFIFGFSLAFKKSKPIRNIDHDIIMKFVEKFVEKRYCRSDFMYLTLKVTTDNLYEFIKSFRKVDTIALMLDANLFSEDYDDMIQRYPYQGNLRIPNKAYLESCRKDPRIHLFMSNVSGPSSAFNSEELEWSTKYFLGEFDFPGTPYFKKKIYEFMKSIEDLIDTDYKSLITVANGSTLKPPRKSLCEWLNKEDIRYSYNLSTRNTRELCSSIQNKSKLIRSLKSIYGSDINLDTLHKVMEELKIPPTLILHTDCDSFPQLRGWIRKNIKPDTLVSLICGDDSVLLQDTLSMLENLSPSQLEKLKKPSRWRNRAFHDHVMVESFKYKGKNKSLPAELFPEPVKVGNWTYSQPRNTLELLLWGKTVMNCVGSADIYAQKVIKRKSLIILASENGKPRLTIDFNLHKNGISQIQDAETRGRIFEKELAGHAKIFLQAVEKVSGKS
jgi:hypothetical protein